MDVGELLGEGRSYIVVKSENCAVRLVKTIRSGVEDVPLEEGSNQGAAAGTEERTLGEAAIWRFDAKASISTRGFRRYDP